MPAFDLEMVGLRPVLRTHFVDFGVQNVLKVLLRRKLHEIEIVGYASYAGDGEVVHARQRVFVSESHTQRIAKPQFELPGVVMLSWRRFHIFDLMAKIDTRMSDVKIRVAFERYHIRPIVFLYPINGRPELQIFEMDVRNLFSLLCEHCTEWIEIERETAHGNEEFRWVDGR